jgi:hypothetical protein
MKKVYMFLDFDGVFHPLIGEKTQFADLNNFEQLVRKHSKSLDIKLIISSSWRIRYSLSELKGIFSKDIAEMVIDVTPVINQEGDGIRLREAQAWMNINQINAPWIALDDDHYAWDRVPNLVWCHDKFQEREIKILEDIFKKLS